MLEYTTIRISRQFCSRIEKLQKIIKPRSSKTAILEESVALLEEKISKKGYSYT